MARRPSTVDRLGPEIRDAIGRLLDDGRTLDEVLAHLEGMSVEVSRSALGRYSKRLAGLGEKLRRSRNVAEALVRRYGDQPESKAARLNIELVHGVITDLFMAEEGDPEGADKAAAMANPQGAMLVAKALEHLTKASRHDVEFIERAEKRATERTRKEAAAAVDVVAKAKGLTSETVAAIKAGIFGVKAA